MGIFRQFPYSNFHDMNMDEIIKIVRQLADDWLEYQTQWANLYTDVNEAFTAFKNDFNTFVAGCDAEFRAFMNSIDVDAELRTVITQMLQDGSLASIIQTPISEATTAWLNANIQQPTTPVIDKSLSVADAGADSFITGINILNNFLNSKNGNTAPKKLEFKSGTIFRNVPSADTTRAYVGYFKAHFLDRIYCDDDTYEYRLGWVSNPIMCPTNEISYATAWQTTRITLPADFDDKYILLLVRKKSNVLEDISDELDTIAEKIHYVSSFASFSYNGVIGENEITALAACQNIGWYGFGANEYANITDLPDGFPANLGGTLINIPYTFKSNLTNVFLVQKLIDINMAEYTRLLRVNNPLEPEVFVNWKSANTLDAINLSGKNVAILGDSISTNGEDGSYPNVPEITITEEDVGVQLRAYLTYYDVQAGLSLGNHDFTSDEIGTEVTFTPNASDIGKIIGKPNNFNPASRVVWWEILQSVCKFNPIPVCWSGASMCSHESEADEYKTSWAWHDAQIRKCGIRTPGTMNRTAPDIIIIYRGVNDFSHSPFTVLDDEYFNNVNWTYPNTDIKNGSYEFNRAYCLTIKKLRTAYPKATIILCSLNMFKRVNYNHFPTNNGINTLPEYNKAIRTIADFTGCITLDFDKDGITFENAADYLLDGTHPNNTGHRAMGNKAIADMTAKFNKM